VCFEEWSVGMDLGLFSRDFVCCACFFGFGIFYISESVLGSTCSCLCYNSPFPFLFAFLIDTPPHLTPIIIW
jgi:hypothetical protein